MKFSLTLHLQAGVLEIESERLDDVSRGYMMARELGATGLLPAGYDYTPVPPGPGPGGTVAVDEGVIREASQDPIEPAPVPETQRETEKPGKKPRAKKEAQAAAETPKTEPAEESFHPTYPEPTADPEPEAPKTDKVPREVAQAKLGDLLRDKGTEPVAALLKKFGATRFGLYVADDYAEFCAAIDEAAQ